MPSDILNGLLTCSVTKAINENHFMNFGSVDNLCDLKEQWN